MFDYTMDDPRFTPKIVAEVDQQSMQARELVSALLALTIEGERALVQGDRERVAKLGNEVGEQMCSAPHVTVHMALLTVVCQLGRELASKYGSWEALVEALERDDQVLASPPNSETENA